MKSLPFQIPIKKIKRARHCRLKSGAGSSPRDVVADFMGLFDPNERILDIYCEGFPKEYVYGPYAKNKRQFTVELSAGYYELFTFFWIFAHNVLGNRNKAGRGR